MKLYYTVSSQSEAPQTKPQLSLGGFKSSSQLANSQFENLFGDITPITISNFNQNRYIGLVLKNETGADITNVKLWFNYPDGCYTNLKVAAVDMIQDQMEHIDTPTSKPLSGDFYVATEEVKADLGDLIDGEMIGIWIERELKLDVITEQQSNIYEPDPALESRYKEKEINKLDEIEIFIEWD
jgi:hypothetical protein